VTTQRLVLVGPMGSGKSTVGQILAERWQVPLDDTDARVEAAAGKSISDIFLEDGEDAFRALERTAVAAAVGEPGPRVVSLGGGSVLDPASQADLRQAVDDGTAVVFLDVGIADASRRVGLNVSRPLLIGNPRAQWISLMNQRRGTYEALATHTVLTDGMSPGEVADQVETLLGGAAS
jgi:shikimate kinase